MDEEDLVKEENNYCSRPPTKRRKMSPRAAISSESSSAEIVVEGSDGAKYFHSNPVIKLAATSNGRHVVAVTSEDKCMRVFELKGDGVMYQTSERSASSNPHFLYCTHTDDW